MIITGLDFETTGLDTINDRVIEVGAILYSTTQKKCLDNLGSLVKSEVPVLPEITKITGITQAAVDRFGIESDEAFEYISYMIEESEALVGHNVLGFDKLVYESWCRRKQVEPTEKLWIDTMYDIPNTEPKKLGYLAADHGFLNLFPHSALSDVQTVLTILEKYDITIILKRALTPTVIIQAHQKRDQNELAKKAKFRWNPEARIWWKAVKETDIDELEKSVTFPIGYASKEITLETLNSK